MKIKKIFDPQDLELHLANEISQVLTYIDATATYTTTRIKNPQLGGVYLLGHPTDTPLFNPKDYEQGMSLGVLVDPRVTDFVYEDHFQNIYLGCTQPRICLLMDAGGTLNFEHLVFGEGTNRAQLKAALKAQGFKFNKKGE